MFVSVTRLRVRSVRYIVAFLWQTYLAQRQVARAAGFVGGRLLVDAHLTFWTLTVWESEKAMKAFRGSGPHAKVMPRLAEWCDEGAYAHWTSSGDGSVPSWPEAYHHLCDDGRLSRVAHPSADHEARHFAEPRLKPLIGKDLKPRLWRD
jgi:heme-degrading monooxygenase HmoA